MSEPQDDRPIADLEEVFADRIPPPDFEDRVLGRVRRDAPWPPSPDGREKASSAAGWLRMAAALVLFGAGWAGARLTADAVPTPLSERATEGDFAGPAYILLLWEGVDFDPGVPPETVAREYADWAEQVARGGTLLAGNELSTARVLTGVMPPAHEPAGIVGGYFVVQAPREQALELATNHPHVAHGGWIEVAPIVLR